jgi:hypothetical protein
MWSRTSALEERVGSNLISGRHCTPWSPETLSAPRAPSHWHSSPSGNVHHPLQLRHFRPFRESPPTMSYLLPTRSPPIALGDRRRTRSAGASVHCLSNNPVTSLTLILDPTCDVFSCFPPADEQGEASSQRKSILTTITSRIAPPADSLRSPGEIFGRDESVRLRCNPLPHSFSVDFQDEAQSDHRWLE